MSPEQVHQVQLQVQSAVEKIAFRKVTADEPLLSTQLIDSIGFVDLVVALEQNFGVSIDINSVSDRNFNTVNEIVKFLETKIS